MQGGKEVENSVMTQSINHVSDVQCVISDVVVIIIYKVDGNLMVKGTRGRDH